MEATDKVEAATAYPLIKHIPIVPLPWKDVLDRIRREFPTASLHVGGAYSTPKVLTQKPYTAPCVEAAVAAICEAIPAWPDGHEWSVSGWLNVLAKGEAVARHDHVKTDDGPNAWAAVLYIMAPPGGSILFYPPGPAPLEITPEPGMLLVFPAGLEHEAPEYRGETKRFSAAFNVRAARVE